MKVTATQIAQIINGNIIGNPEQEIYSFGKIEEAGEGHITFLANEKYVHFLATSKASVIIINEYFMSEKNLPDTTFITVPNAYVAFTQLMQAYDSILKAGKKKIGMHPTAIIGENCTIHEDAYIDALVYINNNVRIGADTTIHPQVFIGENVSIGNHCTIHPGAKIMNDSIIHDNVVIHAGTVIGSDGFGFMPDSNGVYSKVPQLGNVIIENDVEIGANTTIDRATMGSTVIKQGVKIDNLVQIAHNVTVAEHTVIAAQAGISGSTKIGKHNVIGGQVGIVGHISLADGTKINAQSGVSKSVKTPNTALNGTPATDYYASIRSQALTRQLPQIIKRIEALEDSVIK